MNTDIEKELEIIQLRLKGLSLTIKSKGPNPKDTELLRACYEALTNDSRVKPVGTIERLMDRLDML